MHGRRWFLALAAALTALFLLGRAGNARTDTPALNGLSIQGNRFVDDSGQPITMRGVFYPSFEYACSHDGGISSQGITQAQVNELLTWHVNFVRVGVAEDCWLGINGEPRGTTTSAYRQALMTWVDLLHANGIYTEIGLMYAAPGSYPSVRQAPMPDADHSPAFWSSFAAYFKNTPDTIFGLYGEPHPPAAGKWSCWLNGGASCQVTYKQHSYTAAGMQQLVDAIRATGAPQPISVSAVRPGGDLSGWLQYEPNDPLHQLDAEWHQYGGNQCWDSADRAVANNAACWNGVPATVAQSVPLLNGEVGEEIHGNTCAWSFMPVYLTWAEAHNVSYAAWKWGVDDTHGPCTDMALITDSAGDPSPIYGQNYEAWLQSHNP